MNGPAEGLDNLTFRGTEKRFLGTSGETSHDFGSQAFSGGPSVPGAVSPTTGSSVTIQRHVPQRDEL